MRLISRNFLSEAILLREEALPQRNHCFLTCSAIVFPREFNREIPAGSLSAGSIFLLLRKRSAQPCHERQRGRRATAPGRSIDFGQGGVGEEKRKQGVE